MMGTEQIKETSGWLREEHTKMRLHPFHGSVARGKVASRMRKAWERKERLAVGAWHVSARARKTQLKLQERTAYIRKAAV